MVMIPNLQEIPLRHSWLLQPASQDHTLGALLKMACGRCHCALQGKDDYPESSEEIFMSSFEQPNGLKMDDDSDWDWWKKMTGESPVQLANKNLKWTKSFQETAIGNVYSFDLGLHQKNLLYWLLHSVLCTLWKSTRQHCQIVCFCNLTIFNVSTCF